jgi:hypothetical protein
MDNKYDIIAMGDNHGDLACEDTLDAIMEFVKRVKPKYRVHLGDNWDYRWGRRGVDKSSAEAKQGMEDDLQAGISWIKRYKPTHFLFGNHDDRIRQIIQNTDSIKDKEDMQKLQDKMMSTLRGVGCKVIKPYNVKTGRIQIGPITFIHGFSHGQNALLKDARTFGQPGGGFCMGHLHRLEQLNIEAFDGGAAWLCGWAGRQEDADYSFRMPGSLRWQNGFMYFKVDGNNYIGKQAHRFGDGWYFPNGEVYKKR